jgi:hypothetical protein
MPAPKLLSAQYGNTNAYYGNMRYGFAPPTPYVWGAWKVKGHYQPAVIHKAHKEEPLKIAEKIEEPPYDHALVARMQREVRTEKPVKQHIGKKPRYKSDDDEAYFILMN